MLFNVFSEFCIRNNKNNWPNGDVTTLIVITGEVMAVLKLDNQLVGQTQWRQNSQQCWDQRMTFDLDRVSYSKEFS